MKILVSLIIFFISFQAKASQFCFPMNDVLGAKKHLNLVELPSDNLKIYKNCLIANLDARREELYVKFLRMKYRNFTTGGSHLPSGEISQDMCNINSKILINKSSKNKMRRIGGKLIVSDSNSSNVSTQSTSIKTMFNKKARFKIGKGDMFVTCKKSGSLYYQLDIDIASSKIVLSTSVRVKKGEELKIGELIYKNESKNKNINIKSGLNHSQYFTDNIEEVLISVQ